MKNQYRNKNLPNPISIREACSKNYVDNLFNETSILKNTAQIDLNDRNITKASFLQGNQLPQSDIQLTAKLYDDNAIDEISVVRNNRDNGYNNYNLTKVNSITFNKQPENDNEDITKAYVDQFHQENERSRRDVGLDFHDESSDLVKNNQDNDLKDKKLTNIDSVAVNRKPTSDNELANKKYSDDSIREDTIVRFNQTLESYLKVSVGNDTYNLTKYKKFQLSNTTVMKAGNIGGYLLPSWKIVCNDKNDSGKTQNFIKSTKTKNAAGDSGSTSFAPIGNAFLYIETSSNNHGNIAFVSFERTDIIQISNITFYYNRFSILTINSLKSRGRFRVQILLENNTWSTR